MLIYVCGEILREKAEIVRHLLENYIDTLKLLEIINAFIFKLIENV